MPTGYTANLYEGKEESFEDFVLHCARGMGAFIMQRDDNSRDLPKLRVPSEYYKTALAEAETDLARWNSFDDDDVADEYEIYVAEQKASNEHSVRKSNEIRTRYELRLAEVQAWVAPPLLDSFKEFMISQLKDSINFDCHSYISPVQNFSDWCDSRESALTRSVEYSKESLDKEIQRCKEQNEYAMAIYESLGVEVPEGTVS